MARRPIFIPCYELDHLVDELEFDFEWNPGFAPVQKKKNVSALHSAAHDAGIHPLLEVSSKSEVILGQRLSAFSLKIETKIGSISLEAAFQGSKVFKNGGPYTDIYKMDSREAKKDQRLRDSGPLVAFDYFGSEWPLVPKTAFYDWLYLTALKAHQEFLKKLYIYRGFTDIEFNPQKSINCQARTCAMIVSMLKLNLFDEALGSQRRFIEIVLSDSLRKNHSSDLRQGKLL